MMITEERREKVTYTTMTVGQAEQFNRAYDEALERVMGQLGHVYPIYIDHQARNTAEPPFEDRSPNDTRLLLGRFQECGNAEADAAVQAARRAYEIWSRTAWKERIEVLRRAADLFRARNYDIAAWLTLEAGKPRLEAMGEVEEAADLIDAYCGQMEEHDGYVIKLGQLSAQEVNHSVLRPYGVWVVISPFNFPVALLTGMIAGALVGGNTVVFKPSIDTPLTGVKVFECFRDAGIPAGVVNFVTGSGDAIGEALSGHPNVEGIAFTGSVKVGTHIAREFSRERPRPCIAEMGGKNATIVTNSADLQKAVEGTVRAAFGYSGQKCSATSRVYVQSGVADEYLQRLVARTKQVVVGDPRRQDVFMGPVINRGAYQRFQQSVDRAQRDGDILAGGTLLTEGDLEYGYYCAPTLVRLPSDHPFFSQELFVPLVAIHVVPSLSEALQLANDSQFGLTAGIFSENAVEIQTFLDRIEAGVVYVNRKAGSTTGAWPGIQSFGGWKASGSTGKCALGPYYVQQFLREQNQTVVTE